MVNRITTDTGRNSDTAPRTTRNFINPNTSRNNERPPVDDVIASLANAHENRRARQVTEWERMFRQNVQRAA